VSDWQKVPGDAHGVLGDAQGVSDEAHGVRGDATADGDDLRRVEVTVSWTHGGDTNALNAVTYFYRYGIANR
jgi:hypothetical protein